MATTITKTFGRKTPATLRDLRDFIVDQAEAQLFPPDAKVEVLVNFTKGITQISITKE